MPEGDTIYRAARALQKAIGGKVVTAFETGLAKLASVNDDAPVEGRIVERVEARGKWLLIYFSGDLILVTHMLMSGSWHIYRTGEKWWMGRSKMRVAITVAGVEERRFPAGMTNKEGMTNEGRTTNEGGMTNKEKDGVGDTWRFRGGAGVCGRCFQCADCGVSYGAVVGEKLAGSEVGCGCFE